VADMTVVQLGNQLAGLFSRVHRQLTQSSDEQVAARIGVPVEDELTMALFASVNRMMLGVRQNSYWEARKEKV